MNERTNNQASPSLPTDQATAEEAELFKAVIMRARALRGSLPGAPSVFRTVLKQRAFLARLRAAGKTVEWINSASADELETFFVEPQELSQPAEEFLVSDDTTEEVALLKPKPEPASIDELSGRFRARRFGSFDSATPTDSPSGPRSFFRLAMLATLAVNGLAVVGYQAVTSLDESDSSTPMVIITPPDGVPADASKALTINDAVPNVAVVDGDGTTGTLPDGAIGVRLKTPDGSTLPTPVFTPHGTYAKVVDLVVSDTSIPVDQRPLYTAALNRKVVEAAAPAQELQVLASSIWNTPEALRVIREKNERWGGWERTWLIVDEENANRSGQAVIDTPSEYFAFLGESNGVFPNAQALERKAIQDSALIHDARVVKDVGTVEERLAKAQGQTETLKLALKTDPPQAPKDYLLNRDSVQMGSIYEAPDAHTILSKKQTALAQTDPVEERALVSMNLDFKADLSRLKERVLGAQVQEGLLRWARGSNRFGVQALCTNFAIRLDELTSNTSLRTPEEQRQALLDLHSYYFDELKQLTPGRGGYAEYLRAFTAETVMPALAQAWEKLPKQDGVEGVSTDARALVFSTLPDIFASNRA